MHRTGRERVKRFAERVAPVAQTTHPSQAGLARVLNSLVVPPFLRRGNLRGLRVCSNAADTPLQPAECSMWPVAAISGAVRAQISFYFFTCFYQFT